MKKLGIGNLLISVLFLPYWGFAAETPTANRIVLTLDNDSEVHVKGFIAPIAYTQSNFHVEWESLANLRVAEPEKQHPITVFRAFLPTEVGLRKGSGKTFLQRLQSLLRENPTSRGNGVSVGDLWEIEQDGLLKLLRQLHPSPHLDMHINWGDSRGAWACLACLQCRISSHRVSRSCRVQVNGRLVHPFAVYRTSRHQPSRRESRLLSNVRPSRHTQLRCQPIP